MLTQKDIEEIEQIVKKIVDDQTKFIPSKNDFFSRMDKLSKEIQDARDELVLHSGSHDELSETNLELDARLLKVEKKLQMVTSI